MRAVILVLSVGVLSACGIPAPKPAIAQTAFQSEQAKFRVEPVAEGLENPWSLAFLPDGRMLVTERPGRLRLVSVHGDLSDPIGGLPEITAERQGGLLDVVLDPDFQDNRRIYLSYSVRRGGTFSTDVARAVLDGENLREVVTIFHAGVAERGAKHFGSRLTFDRDGMLLITHGDRGNRSLGQERSSYAGSVIRITKDGDIPNDNPYAGQSTTKPGIFTLGHRNPQGMALHPQTGAIWTHEHGPRGGDEVNILQPGANYGWPMVSHGAEYASGLPVSEETSLPGLIDPVHLWIPSIAPSGMMFYQGEAFPQWKGDLFVGALAAQSLVRLELDGEQVISEERLLEGELGRIRDVRLGPDQAVYLLIDDADGGVFRLVPIP